MTARNRALRVFRTSFALGAFGWAVSFWAAESTAEPASPSDAATKAAATTPADPNDLGHGLRFLQLTTVRPPADQIAKARDASALVLDLRLADKSQTVAEVLDDLLGAKPGRPVFILIGTKTPRTVFDRASERPGTLSIGTKDAGLSVGLALSIDATQTQCAAAEIAKGKHPADLIGTRIDKARFDEARLAMSHANGFRDLARANTEEQSNASDAESSELAPSEDLLLQRAVFLHRALLALGRIPEHT